MNTHIKYFMIVMGLCISSVISAQVTGPNTICSGSSGTFSASNWAANYVWTASYNLSISNAFSNPTTITATGTGAAWVVLKNDNGGDAGRKDLWIGVPSIYISGPSSVSVNSGNQYTAYSTHSSQSITSYQWAVSPSSTLYDYGNWVSIYFGTEGTYRVSVRAYNGCGWSPWEDFYVDAYNHSPSPAYPNPASDILNIDVGSTSNAKTQNLTYDIRLYNAMGSMMRQTGNRGSGTVQIDVSNLPNGTYLLHIYDGVSGTPEVQRIIVKH